MSAHPIKESFESNYHSEKFADHSASSSSDSDDEKNGMVHDVIKEKIHEMIDDIEPAKSNIYRIFGREKPVHQVLGGGKPADVILWRNKKFSAGVLGIATLIWVLFELLEYHLLTVVCHMFIFSLAILFLWSNASAFIYKSRPHIPEIDISENVVLEFASALRIEINRGFSLLRDIAAGKDLKKFLAAIVCLWIISVFGNWFNFISVVYTAFVVLQTLAVLYEKYEEQVDGFGEKAIVEIKKRYAVFDSKVLHKLLKRIPKQKKVA